MQASIAVDLQPEGGADSGPAKPVPRRPLGTAAVTGAAVQAPSPQIDMTASIVAPRDPAARYVAYCRSGRRSSVAAFLLSQLGYDVVSMAGGVLAWGDPLTEPVPED